MSLFGGIVGGFVGFTLLGPIGALVGSVIGSRMSETRTHRRIIDIYSPSAKTIDALMKLDLPSGVDIEVKL